MRKKLSISLLTIASAAILWLNPAKAYDIKMEEPVFEDYIPLLQQAGYFVYRFDIKSLNDNRYDLSFSIHEYEHDSLVNKNVMTYPFKAQNMSMVKEFPEEDQKSFKPEELYDSARGILSCSEKIVLGTYHDNDSTTRILIDVDNMGMSVTSLPLRPLHDPQTGKELYIYMTRPFRVGEIKLDAFIPLMYYGSAWLDKDFGFFRFCGENILDPEMTARLIKDVPHSYVIGVTVTRKDQ